MNTLNIKRIAFVLLWQKVANICDSKPGDKTYSTISSFVSNEFELG